MNRDHLFFLTAVAIAAIGQIALKKGAAGELSFWRQYLNPYVGLGYLLMIASMGIAAFAYRGIPLKEGPVLDSLGFILVPLLSRALFNERLTVTKILGFALILTGVGIFSI